MAKEPEKKVEPMKDPEFQKVVNPFLKTPPELHKSKAKLKTKEKTPDN